MTSSLEKTLNSIENEISSSDEYKKIVALNKEVCQKINEATKLCDKLGISFCFSASPLSQFYYAKNLNDTIKKYSAQLVGKIDENDEEVSEDVAEEVLRESLYDFFAQSEYDVSGDWEHSSVC